MTGSLFSTIIYWAVANPVSGIKRQKCIAYACFIYSKTTNVILFKMSFIMLEKPITYFLSPLCRSSHAQSLWGEEQWRLSGKHVIVQIRNWWREGSDAVLLVSDFSCIHDFCICCSHLESMNDNIGKPFVSKPLLTLWEQNTAIQLRYCK